MPPVAYLDTTKQKLYGQLTIKSVSVEKLCRASEGGEVHNLCSIQGFGVSAPNKFEIANNVYYELELTFPRGSDEQC